jgi:hypothetical protein
MSSKSHRRKIRAQRRRNLANTPTALDPHSEVVMQSLAGMLEGIARFSKADDPKAAIDATLAELVDKLAGRFCTIDPARAIEVARLACLPWSHDGGVPAGSQNGPTEVELIALIAITAADSATCREDPNSDSQSQDARRPEEAEAEGAHPEIERKDEPGPITEVVNEAVPLIDRILQLAQLRELARADRQDPLAMIAAMVRGSEIWIRNTSYPDMVSGTLIDLYNEPNIAVALRSDLGFEVRDALAVLSTCHTLQVKQLNDRMQHMGATVIAAQLSTSDGNVDENIIADARRVWDDAWEPSVEAATVSAAEIAEATGLSRTVVEAVLDFFTLDMSGKTSREAVDDFTGGLSPLRTHPLISSANARVMLVHDAQNPVAIRERFEQHLKTTALWDTYQQHRGHLLESRTQALFARVLPGAHTWDGFKYYVPVDEAEAAGDPAGYTKRVEGDHLIVQDDVAIIVEDKAVAMSPVARSGQTQRLRRDLTGIIRKAADQATRLQDRIQQDGGIRVDGEGWIDLSRIREIHTVAVSLDDLSGASTATAELVKAALLDASHIPWTVSVHDLDLITQLVDRPAEFLLYLRRRRDPEVTVFYTVPDELDLFLYFFEAGLYVEPDPDKIRVALPWMPPVTTAERRRRREQHPAYITSRTDALDRWHYAELARAQTEVNGEDRGETAMTTSGRSSKDSPAGADKPQREPHAAANASQGTGAEEAVRGIAEIESDPVARKPSMVPSPLEWLIDAVRDRGDYAWLSIGATLLSGSTEFQEKLARIPGELLDNPFGDGRERSITIPFASSVEDGWLLAWITRPPGRKPRLFEQDTRDYLRSKMHQLGLRRGVAFCFDETTRELVGVYFDDHVGELEPSLAARLPSLKPPEDMTSRQPPYAKTRPGSKKQTQQRAKERKKH